MMKSFVREPAVAGTFYYASAPKLRDSLQELFSGTKQGKCTGVVSPHAGYVYSGRAAAQAISSLKPAKTFIILGPNHTGLGSEFSVMGSGAWETPLGRCSINEDVASVLKADELLEEDVFAHEQEHSIEVQLPFLQYLFKEFDFVPITIMNESYSSDFRGKCEDLGIAIAKAAKNHDIGIIASSDFSHYVPFDEAKKKDSKAIKFIEALDLKGFFRTLQENDASICGFGPIAVLMSAMKALGKKGKLMAYTSSGEATKDYSSVVAYAAIRFE